MAYDVGNIAKFTLTVGEHDVSTAVAVAVTAPDGTTSAPAAATTDGGATWKVQVPLTQAGTWVVLWTVTGGGAGTKYDQADADPVPPPTEEQRAVRMLISDTDPANRFFSTLEIQTFLTMNGLSTRRAAAQALDVMAGNEAMVSKKIRTQDLSTDGPAVAEALRKLAAELRRQADQGEGDDESSGFDIVEFEPNRCYRTDWFF